MRAVVLREHGDVDVLRVEDVPVPTPGPDEVLVRVRSSAMNRADVLQRRGGYPNPFPEDLEIPGLELAGTVEAVGGRVRRWAPGDRVMSITGGGAHAEFAVVHERQLMAVPTTVALADAGAIPEVFLTAWDALVVQGGLTSGRWALVHAGASGVGTAAIQICRAIGARIIVTCSTGKVDACRELGADVVVDYTADDFVSICADVTGGLGVDVVLDVIGGDYVNRNLQAIRVGGSIVQVGVMGGGSTPVNVGLMLPKRATLVGTVLRARPLEEKIAISQRFAAEVLPLFESGLLTPVIDSRLPLERVADAHRRMEANANVGKIVLDVGAD